jgi:hypothetical protein
METMDLTTVAHRIMVAAPTAVDQLTDPLLLLVCMPAVIMEVRTAASTTTSIPTVDRMDTAITAQEARARTARRAVQILIRKSERILKRPNNLSLCLNRQNRDDGNLVYGRLMY